MITHALASPVRVRRRPTEVEAIQVSASNVRMVADWITEHGGSTAGLSYREGGPIEDRGVWIGTLEGTMEARVGWWVIRGVAGEFYPCRPDIFDQTYEILG